MGPLFLLLFLVVGYGARKRLLGDTTAVQLARRLNLWVIRVALPCVVFEKILSIPSLEWSEPEIFLPISQPWLHFALCVVLFFVLARALRWDLPTRACLALTVGLGNTSFVGLPLLRATLGERSLPIGILQDQLGTFLILAVLGAPLAELLSTNGHAHAIWKNLLRPLRFPPFLTLLAALALRGTSLPWQKIQPIVHLLGETLAPAALTSVGLGLRFSALKNPAVRTPLLAGIVAKLVLLPFFTLAVYSQWGAHYPSLDPLVTQTILLESAMASMIMAGIVAAENGLNPELARLMVGLSIPLSLLTVPLWHLWVGRFLN